MVSRLGGVYNYQVGNHLSGGKKSVFAGGFDGVSSYPTSGCLDSNSFVLPLKPGALASFTLSNGAIVPNANLIPAYNLQGSASSLISVVQAQLDQIVSAIASGSMSISNLQAIMAGAANAGASSSSSVAVVNALCGAIFSVLASGNSQVSASAVISAIANISADAGGAPALSPEGLANAVLDALLSAHNQPGSVGNALNSIGASSNPWGADIDANADVNTFGELIQKLLKKTDFIGLK